MSEGAERAGWTMGAKILTAIAALLLLVLMAVAGGYYWLDSRSGHSFVARQIEALEFENGMKIRIGSIDGSIYGKARVTNLRIADPKGDFVRVPVADLDWRPLAYLNGHVDVRSLFAKELYWTRMPAFNVVPDTGEPLLPDLDIDIGRLKVDRIIVDKSLTGRAHVASLDGNVHIADRRAVVKARAYTVRTADMAGGDRLDIKLDAVPDKNVFDVDMALNAPANGLFAGLLGKEAATTARIAGKGSWDKWDGAFTARSGGAELADVALTARKGTFTMKGYARPDQLLGEGALANALAPVAGIDMTATVKERRVALVGAVASQAITLVADGKVDLAQSEFEDMVLNLKVDRTTAFAPNMSGRDVRGRMLLNGSFASPIMNYSLSAARLAFDDVALEGLVATGEATVDSDRIRIPVNARVRRISGLSEAAGGLLTNVTLNGNLAVADGRMLSDNMRVRSDRINATAILIGDFNKGFYSGALKGRVNGYRVESVGLFNVDADADVKTERNGFALVGSVRARSTRLFSPGLRNFLGGNMFVNAGLRYGTDGVIRITSARVVAPQFRLNSGSGTYLSNGRITFKGSGYSNQYGPLSATVTGTLTSPIVRVVAARPGYGIGLSNVVADVRQTRSGFDVVATGDTTYGKFTADLDILSGSGPMVVNIRRGDFAGITVAGRLVQEAAGPFAGRLTGVGSGFDGTIDLSGVGDKQRLVVDAVAQNARLEGPPPIAIGRAIINADVVLYDQPQIVADVQLAETTRDALSIAVARAKIDYRNGQGTAQIMAEGRNGVPFKVAGNAAFTPDMWRIAAKGRANSIDFETDGPVRIALQGDSYRILPSSVKVGRGGNVRVAGVYGDAIDIQSRLENVHIGILNPMLPDIGVGGRASGSFDWYQASANAFPRADARLTVDDFTRTSISGVSQPVDIALVGRLLPDGGNMRAVIRRLGAPVGRLQVDLTPLPPGTGGWVERLLASPLTGGLRYNGPADTLFSLAALQDQSLKGNVGVAADFSGRVQDPHLSGVVRANDLVYENSSYGTKLTKLRVRGTFVDDRLDVTELTAQAGEGTVKGSGFVSLSAAQGFPIQLNLDLNNARLARSDMIGTTATGQIEVVSNANTPPTVRGTLRLPETRFRIIRQNAAKVATLTGVRRKPSLGPQRVSGNADAITSLPSNWRLDINLDAPDELYVSGMGLESEWGAKLHITGTSDAPIMAGQMNLIRGTLSFASRSFELEQGRLSFDGGPATNPTVRVSAAADVDGVTVRVNVTGTGYNPQISFTSTPALPQDEVMARILFGNSIGELNAIQAVQLAASLNSLRGGAGGLNPLGVLQSGVGIDRLRILNADETTGRGTAVALGQYITNDVYVEIVTDARGYTATQIEISLTRALSVLSQMSTFGTSNVNVRYRKDY